ncbi:MAG: ABC transporter substrate-binding protein [Anaerolineae bacterium]|nr:ABC transporter substrate-binding protein [Anaerolineae bacterium]MDW8098053.1 ABC transporter substrate-binding protein [Anaerolineae bacterium]
MSELNRKKLSRRDFLRASATLAGASLLAACAPVTPAPAAPPAAEVKPVEATPTISPAEEERRKTVIFDIDGGRVISPDLWNFYVPGSRLDHGYHQAVLEPLFILNYETGEIEPWLGESMTSNETMDVWTLKLRQGVAWSDGHPFTADDVVFTIQMLIDHAPELNWSAGIKDWVAKVEKIDDLTVQFTLTRPNPRFQLDNFSVRIWGGPSIVPKHIWEGQDPLTFKFYDPEKGWPVGTGPYKLVSISETEFIYVRDNNWWGAKTGWKPLPKPEKLIWTWAGPEEKRTALMANRQLDSLMDITLGALQALKQQNPNVITWFDELPYAWVPDPCSRTFEFNCAIEPWNDPEMRWAINYAIDRDQIVAIAYEGTTFKSKHFFPAYKPLNRYVELLEKAGLYEKYPLWKHDPALAKQIIESKGWKLGSDGYYYKDGKQLAMLITTHEAFIEKQRIAQVIVEQLQAIGINATNRNEAGATWGDNFAFGNFEARMGWQTCGSVNEPWASMDTFNVKWLTPIGERSSYNNWRWSGPAAEEYSKLVDEIGSLPLGDPKIDELFVKAMELWLKELPVIPITQARKIIPFDTTYWTNWPTAKNNYMHPPTWWQSTHKIIHSLQPAQG